jgi:DNA repair exonuclease SbcCD ATPase subunit
MIQANSSRPNLPVTPRSGNRTVTDGQTRADNPTALYLAAVRQRDELKKQVSSLEDTRRNLSEQLSEPNLSSVNKAGLEVRLAQTDKQLSEAQDALAAANAKVAQAAAVPGTNTLVAVPSPRPTRDMPKNVAIVSLMFLAMATAVLLPISIAYARRLMGKTAAPKPQGVSPDLDERLRRMEQAIESVAIEVERVGEGQRFVTQLLAEGPARSLQQGAGAAEPMPVKARDTVR